MARRRGEGGASCCERGRRHATVGPRCLARAYPICLCGDGLYATAALRGAPARARRAPPPHAPITPFVLSSPRRRWHRTKRRSRLHAAVYVFVVTRAPPTHARLDRLTFHM
jgi:hypothetical protein